ncbi:MAG: universal stress protein [Gammaproteobacteria bacterium]|jgi:universal stress protein E|nr:universal stress protein [Gammaproteobacteria bacterium]MBT4491876.1 universal stress protein [Gammaproteobacteria bacterium]
MINRFKKILFFADGARSELAALRRSYGIARHNGAELTVIGVVDEVSTNDMQLQPSIRKIQESLINERSAEIDKLVESIGGSEHGIKKIVVPGKEHVEVIRNVADEGFDVVIKAVNSKTAVAQAIFGSTDTQLMHYAPCPVMILKPFRRKSWRSLVAAVDPRVETEQEMGLNSDLLAMAVSIAEIESADLHVLHVLDHPLSSHKSKMKAEYRELEVSLEADATRKMRELTEGFGHVSLKEHLIKGKPHSTIAEFVATHEADLLVMGSVGRSGIPGFFVGNTAEKILNHVDCSVMVLKPRGWKTPVN